MKFSPNDFRNSGLIGFRSEKAAQAASYFAQAEGGRIDKLKLIKLLYLAERESIKKRGHPMFYDEFYSLVHGPICSNSLRALNKEIDESLWREYIVISDKKNIRSAKKRDPAELKQFSPADRKILAALWAEHGSKTASQLRKWTHENCPEYVEVEAGRLPITYTDLYKVLGYEDPAAMEALVQEHRSSEAALARFG